MKTLLTIRDQDLSFVNPFPEVYRERRAARALIFDEAGKIALLHVAKRGYHKLPGGGIEASEEIEQALQRELQEEIGCSAKNIRELGVVEEYRQKFSLHQVSYCYLAELDGSKGQPHPEEEEIVDGFAPVWLNLEEAIDILESEGRVNDYEGRFICRRDLTFLRAGQELRRLAA
jgi:ADP-ribose pyrophosphatase YjhB (NUDIX family)